MIIVFPRSENGGINRTSVFVWVGVKMMKADRSCHYK